MEREGAIRSHSIYSISFNIQEKLLSQLARACAHTRAELPTHPHHQPRGGTLRICVDTAWTEH